MAKRTFKVKKKLSRGASAYRAWAKWDEGDVLIGEFVSIGEDQFDKPNYTCKVIDAQFSNTKEAKKIIGKTFTLNSAGFLDKAFLTKDGELKIEIGEMFQVIYSGMSEMPGGKFKGKDAHTGEVDLLVNEDEEEDDEDLEDDDYSDEEDEDEEDDADLL